MSRRPSSFDQQIKDAGQMRTPPPITPRDIESRVLRICNEYDKVQEAQKNKVNLDDRLFSFINHRRRWFRSLWQLIL